MDPSFLFVDSEDSDQIKLIPKLSHCTFSHVPAHISILMASRNFRLNFQSLTVVFSLITLTVKPVLSGQLKISKTKFLIENGSLMNVESIAECSPWSILQYF